MAFVFVFLILFSLSPGGAWALDGAENSTTNAEIKSFSEEITLSYSIHEMANKEILRRNSQSELLTNFPEEYSAATLLASVALGRSSYHGVKALSFGNVLNILRSASPNLSTQGKLLVLRDLGTGLASGYDYSMSNQTSLESVFQNAKNQGSKGGVCGDIHEYLAKSAQALGFENAGVHSGKWEKNELSPSEGHFVSHYRDPVSGDYYVQNYNSIINTNKKDLTSAVDISTRMLGPLTNVSMIEGRPGVYHAYTPIMSRWVFASIDRLFKNGNSHIVVEASNYDKFVGLDVSGGSETDSYGLFALQNRVTVGGANYDLSMIGVQVASHNSQKMNSAWMNEIGSDLSVKVGNLQISSPNPLAGNLMSQSSAFIDARIAGFAKINKTTGTLELTLQNNDIATPLSSRNSSPNIIRIKGTINQQLSPSTILQVERGFINSRSNYEMVNAKMMTEYDRLAVIVDTRTTHEKVYIRYEGALYALEGIRSQSAAAIKQEISAVISAGAFGEFSVILDANKILSNPQNDPIYQYYDQATAYKIALAWKKELGPRFTVGSNLESANRPAFHLFNSANSPADFYLKNGNWNLTIWVSAKF